ncbi:MAG: tetratricopeptide repeat protein, partial [Cyanobacteria bacterium P01_E01_bin.43]
MRHPARLLGLAALTALLSPVLEVAAAVSYRSETWIETPPLSASAEWKSASNMWLQPAQKAPPRKLGLPLLQDRSKPRSVLPDARLKTTDEDVLLQIEGQLDDGDDVLQDGSVYDTYTFNGEAGQFIEIRLSSDAFDTYLILVGPDGERVAENDDSPEGLNSIIYIQLPQAGRYSVLTNAYDASGRGRYQLAVAIISSEKYQQAQEIEISSAEADRLLQQGIEQYNISQFREARQSWQQALQIYQDLGDRTGAANTLNNLGIVNESLGNYPAALDYYEQSLVITRDIGDRTTAAATLIHIGE